MIFVTEGQLRQRLEPHYGRIARPWLRAMEDYMNEHPPATRFMNSKRCRANFLRDHALHYAKEEFKGTTGFRVIENRGLELLVVEDAVGLVFRKTDKRQRLGPIKTQQQMDFCYTSRSLGYRRGWCGCMRRTS